jgi:DDE superfamily endonuclease
MPPLPDAIILVLAPFAPRFSDRVWRHAQVWLVGAMLAPGARTVTAALRVMGLAGEHRFTTDHGVLNRATWSARHGSRMLLGLRITLLVPAGATLVFGADDTVERRSGRKITAKGCDRDAVRSSQKPVIRCFGLKGVSRMLLVPVPWSRRVWALPFRTALCQPAEQQDRRRHQTSVAGVRQMIKQLRRWLPGRQLVLVGDGGFAAVSLALACVNSQVAMVSRLRWDAALDHPPGPQPQGKRGPKPLKGKRQRRLPGWAERSETPGETMEVDWSGGQRNTWWVFSRTALWDTPRVPPVAIRSVLVADPERQVRMAALFCTDLATSPAQILPWVVMRWSVEVTCEECRAPLGLATQRPWSSQAIARTTPILFGLFSLVTVLALRLSGTGSLPAQQTAWYRKGEPTFVDCLAWVRQHLWRARYGVHSTPEAEPRLFPPEAFDLLIHGTSFAASLAKVECQGLYCKRT